MPLYEYRCNRCGTTFEVMQKFSDAPLATHPECGGDVERLLSAPALQFKGSGWYVTDYARNSSGPGSAKNSDAKSEGKPEAKSDAKTETKAESKPAPKTSSDQ